MIVALLLALSACVYGAIDCSSLQQIAPALLPDIDVYVAQSYPGIHV